MGAGASAAESRVFCHNCGARSACGVEALEDPECIACGARDGVELTDTRLPVTPLAGPPSGVAALGHSALGAVEGDSGGALGSHAPRPGGLARQAALAGAPAGNPPGPMRVESVTVVAVPRPEEGGLLLRVLPNMVAQRPASAGRAGTAEVRGAGEDVEDWESPPEPACHALVSRLQATPLAPEATTRYGVCVICAEDIADVETPVIELGCAHAFHEECIKQWLTRRHTCPVCRLELETDSVTYLRTIGLSEEADELEKEEQARQEQEEEEQAAARRRWVESMRVGVPVHFGLSCERCAETPLIGVCHRCTSCEGYVLCGDCYAGRKESDHPGDHTFREFGAAGDDEPTRGGDAPPRSGDAMPLLVQPAQPDAAASNSDEMQGDAAVAAAEMAFVAMHSARQFRRS